MNNKVKFMMGVASAAFLLSVPAIAQTKSVTEKNSTVNPDGSVSYQSHTVVTDAKSPVVGTTAVVVDRPVTFYYFDPKVKTVVASSDLTNNVFELWDTDRNRSIDNHEFYTNQMVAYEPVEYTKRTYQDLNADGVAELTQEEYTVRMQKLPYYTGLDTDKKQGLTLYEFSGIGFQEADLDDDNQVSYDELRKAFYGQSRLASEPALYNK